MPERRTLRVVAWKFWNLVGDGIGPEEAAEAVGVSKRCGRQWFTEAGGVKPRLHQPDSMVPSLRLSFAEREEIAIGVAREESIRSIADRLGRAPSTILREIARNGPRSRGHGRTAQYRRKHRFGSPQDGRAAVVQYRATLAQQRSENRARRPKAGKLAKNERLRAEVQARLDDRHSPEQIAHRLRHDFPDNPEMWVSHETIYQTIYVQGRGALRRDLHKCLRTGRALRKPHCTGTDRRGRIPNMVNISERPAEVDDRAVPGHWEGDLVRHEALCDRVEVKDLHRCAVAAA